MLLAAQFKAGKTTLAANVARSLLDGDPFLGREVHGIDGAVSLFDFEMNDTQLDAWYADQQIANDNRLVMFPMRGAASSFDILNHDVRAGWVATLKAHHVRYLILDCLRPVLDALGLNEHTQVGLFLTALDALLREAGIPEALVIQHMGHKGERARGDSRLLDWPDVGWTLVRTDDDDPASPRYFKAYGRDVDVPETQLTYDESTRRLAIGDVDMTRHNAKTEAALMAICKFLGGGEVQSGKQIEAALAGNGVTRDAIRKALRHGLECGALVEEEGGRGGGKRYRSTVGSRPDFLPLEHGGHAR